MEGGSSGGRCHSSSVTRVTHVPRFSPHTITRGCEVPILPGLLSVDLHPFSMSHTPVHSNLCEVLTGIISQK